MNTAGFATLNRRRKYAVVRLFCASGPKLITVPSPPFPYPSNPGPCAHAASLNVLARHAVPRSVPVSLYFHTLSRGTNAVTVSAAVSATDKSAPVAFTVQFIPLLNVLTNVSRFSTTSIASIRRTPTGTRHSA